MHDLSHFINPSSYIHIIDHHVNILYMCKVEKHRTCRSTLEGASPPPPPPQSMHRGKDDDFLKNIDHLRIFKTMKH